MKNNPDNEDLKGVFE